jgi:hypothetical protein
MLCRVGRRSGLSFTAAGCFGPTTGSSFAVRRTGDEARPSASIANGCSHPQVGHTRFFHDPFVANHSERSSRLADEPGPITVESNEND